MKVKERFPEELARFDPEEPAELAIWDMADEYTREERIWLIQLFRHGENLLELEKDLIGNR